MNASFFKSSHSSQLNPLTCSSQFRRTQYTYYIRGFARPARRQMEGHKEVPERARERTEFITAPEVSLLVHPNLFPLSCVAAAIAVVRSLATVEAATVHRTRSGTAHHAPSATLVAGSACQRQRRLTRPRSCLRSEMSQKLAMISELKVCVHLARQPFHGTCGSFW